LGEILHPDKCNIPPSYRASVYLDTGDGILLPFYPVMVIDPSDHRVFRSGHGATGRAFESGSPFAVVGDGVSSGEFGLTRAQQHAFKEYQVVAAVPIRMAGDADMDDPIIGVLSVISKNNDQRYASDGNTINNDGINELQDLAARLGVACDGLQGLY
jgi:hypothetical protein